MHKSVKHLHERITRHYALSCTKLRVSSGSFAKIFYLEKRKFWMKWILFVTSFSSCLLHIASIVDRSSIRALAITICVKASQCTVVSCHCRDLNCCENLCFVTAQYRVNTSFSVAHFRIVDYYGAWTKTRAELTRNTVNLRRKWHLCKTLAARDDTRRVA